MTDPKPDFAFAASDVAVEIGRWLSYLGHERRMSPKTLDAYARDISQFLGFLAEHLGGAPSLKQLAKLTPQDVRAFMAARRADDISARSLMRALAGARSFARFLERNGKGKVGALNAVRAPKVPKTLPKPLAVPSAKRIADTDLRAGEDREPWIFARDAAVLALLYGSGLRIAEALSLKRQDVPAPGAGDRHDRHRQRQQDPHGACAAAGAAPDRRLYCRFVLTTCRITARFLSAPKAARCRLASFNSPWNGCAAR